MTERYLKLTNVEADIIRYFVWREIRGKEEWFEGGGKELAKRIARHEKPTRKAVKKLAEKGMISTRKITNRIWIKLTLTNDELYTRMFFIDEAFCKAQSMQELQTDLIREIKRLEEEIIETKIINSRNHENDLIIDSVLQQITEADIDELVGNFLESTYANSNKSPEELIDDALLMFRENVFSKHSKTIESEYSVEENENYFFQKLTDRQPKDGR